MKTKTSSFGVSKREGHDSSSFYERDLYKNLSKDMQAIAAIIPNRKQDKFVKNRNPEEWADQIYCHTSEDMFHIPNDSVALAFTSPPYNAGKDYDENINLAEYMGLISRVGAEVFRVLMPGGRYVVNIANLGRKPYIPLHSYFYSIHINVGFLPAGEIIWQKAKGASGSCAWGSWKSAKAPRLRDIHEYLLVFVKEKFSRKDKGESDINGPEFMEATLSIWNIPPESAKKVGHPAPFPVDLALRVIRLYSYKNDVVLDPFVGSGTTCVAAKQSQRHYVGYDTDEPYCSLASKRLSETAG
jgi:modification methylase